VRCFVPADREASLVFARERFERLDLLVNNAGIAPRERRDVLEASEGSFDELIGTNLKGPHFLTQLAARWMLEHCEGASFRDVYFFLHGFCEPGGILHLQSRPEHVGGGFAQRLAAKGILVFECGRASSGPT